MKAIIVDDDSFIRQVLKMMLDELSINVVKESGTLADARSAIKDYPVDVVFLDIMLPDGDGMDLIEDVKAAQPDCKILMISGSATKDKVQDSISRGANGFIVKPFNANIVVKNIAGSLNVELPDGFNG
ncbi:MAG: response regulator [Gammaproteobacteria bacterium]|nr:response regulator [Gammaproteobacteria bacterium]